MPDEKTQCKKCGKCCFKDVPVTLFDIYRIARHLGISVKAAFEYFIQDCIPARPSLYMIRKKENNACVFLGDDNRCIVHGAQPLACELYQCGLFKKQNIFLERILCTPWQLEKQWKQPVFPALAKD